MLSNLVNQLREMDALDKIDEVYKELPRVRKDLGQIPLVTPTSQIVGIQTVNNVLFDTPEERYKMITGQVKDLCYGLYGKTAVPINPEVQKKALKGYDRGEEPITCRPAEVLEPEMEKPRKRSAIWPWIWTTWCFMPSTRLPARSSWSGNTARKSRPRSRQSHYPGAGQGQGCAAQESQGRRTGGEEDPAPRPRENHAHLQRFRGQRILQGWVSSEVRRTR
jgi:hypothetical protein